MSIRTFFGLIGLCFSENRRKTTSEKKIFGFFFLFRDYVWDCRRWIFSAKRFNWQVKLGVDRHCASGHFHLGNCSRIRSIVFSATPRSYESRQVYCIICVLVILKFYQWYVYVDIASSWKPFIGLLLLSDIHWVCEGKIRNLFMLSMRIPSLHAGNLESTKKRKSSSRRTTLKPGQKMLTSSDLRTGMRK